MDQVLPDGHRSPRGWSRARRRSGRSGRPARGPPRSPLALDDQRDQRAGGHERHAAARRRPCPSARRSAARRSRVQVRSSSAMTASPLRSIRPRISPTRPRRTASGLSRTRVRSVTDRDPTRAALVRPGTRGVQRSACSRSTLRPKWTRGTTARRRPAPRKNITGTTNPDTTRATCSAQPTATPSGARSSPHSTTHSDQRRRRRPSRPWRRSTSVRSSATSPAKKITKNSQTRTAAQIPLTTGRGRSSRLRASPTVMTEPVTSTPAPASVAVLLGQRDRRLDARRPAAARPRPGPRRTPRPPRPPARRPPSRGRRAVSVTTTSASTGSNASSMPRTSLSAIAPTTPTSRVKPNAPRDRGGGGLRARRVVRGVQDDGRRAADDLEAAGRGDGGEAGADDVDVEPAALAGGRRRRTPRPRRARTAALCAWWAPCSGRNTSSYSPREAAQRRAAGRRRRPCADIDAELQALAGDRRVHLDGPAQQHLGGVDRLLGEHAVATRLEDPGLLGRRSPRRCRPASACGRARSG